VAGIAADVLVRALSPSPTRPAALRTVAFAIPAIYFALYLASLALTPGWVVVPLWSGPSSRPAPWAGWPPGCGAAGLRAGKHARTARNPCR